MVLVAPAVRGQVGDAGGNGRELLGAWHSALRLREVLRDGEASAEDSLNAARAELALGRPDRARAILVRLSPTDTLSTAKHARLLGLAAFDIGDFETAGEQLLRAANYTAGVTRALLLARAGDAYEQAGRLDKAVARYQEAAGDLPQIGGWLELRRARIIVDSAAAFELLAAAPDVPAEEVYAARATILARAGDTTNALDFMILAGRYADAAALALAAKDTARARDLVYESLSQTDSNEVREGLELAIDSVRPTTPAEHLAIARALNSFKEPAQAARYVGSAVRSGDTAATTLLFWGALLELAGNRRAALRAYGRAAGEEGMARITASYRWGRVLLQLGSTERALSALSAFAEGHPGHPDAPVALYVVAERQERSGNVGAADSVYRSVARRWPKHEYASRSRMRLASIALARADTNRAVDVYESEVDLGAPHRFGARFMLARLALAAGDSASAAAGWQSLSREDSIGYYGAIARRASGHPLPAFDPTAERIESPEVSAALRELDLLAAAGFERESEALLSHLMRDDSFDVEELLDLAEGLVERGRSNLAIRLGWRAARELTLNNPRVVMAVYPWPFRELIEFEAREFGLDPYLVTALIRQESNFMPFAESRAGARGLMQLMSATAAETARRMGVDWSDELLAVPDANLHIGAAYLAWLVRYFNHSIVAALAAYNAGPGTVSRWRRLPGYRDPVSLVERMPYEETRGHVKAVLRNRDIYRSLYPLKSSP